MVALACNRQEINITGDQALGLDAEASQENDLDTTEEKEADQEMDLDQVDFLRFVS